MRRLLINRHSKTIARIAVGWLFIFLGLIGLALPLLQGILFLIIGVAILAPYVPLFRKLRDTAYHRFPRLHSRVRLLRRWWHRKTSPRTDAPSK